MTDHENDDQALEAFFAAGRDSGPIPPDRLLARVLSDAVAIRNVARSQPSFWARIGAEFGGWRGLGGLALASAAGLWIGYAGLADPAALLGGDDAGATETVELMPEAEIYALAMAEEF